MSRIQDSRDEKKEEFIIQNPHDAEEIFHISCTVTPALCVRQTRRNCYGHFALARLTKNVNRKYSTSTDFNCAGRAG